MYELQKIGILARQESLPEQESTWFNKFKDSLSEVLNYLDCRENKLEFAYDSLNSYSILLIILSHKEIQDSDWVNEVNKELEDNHSNRTSPLIILREPLDYAEGIDFLEKYSSIPLYCFNNSTQEYQTLDFEPSGEDEKIWQCLLDVGYEIRRILRAEPEVEHNSHTRIYLARTTPDQEYYRQNLMRELMRWGFDICPRSFLPNHPEKLKTKVRQHLEGCSLSIHIIGEQYGEKVGESNKSLIDLQNEVVAEFIQNKYEFSNGLDDTYRFIWINPERTNISIEQQNYINKIKNDLDFLKSTEIVETPLELFKTGIKSRLYWLNNQPLKRSNAKQKKKKQKIYLIAKDYEGGFTSKIEEELVKNDYTVLKLHAQNKKSNLYGLHKKHLVEADGVLVCNKEGNLQWLKSKMSDILKAPGFGKKDPFMAKGLILPENIEVSSVSFGMNLTSMKFKNGDFSPSLLTPFMNQLRKKVI